VTIQHPSRRARRAALLSAVALGGCGWFSSGDDGPPLDLASAPPEAIYADAQRQFDSGDYEEAVKLYDEVERQHPYSTWATKAQLMSAYASYEQSDYDGAVVALDRFIALHPGSPELAYAYYLKALSYYDRIADVERDQRITELALASLNDVVTRFPDTDYARDSKLKLDLAYDQLAGKEMSIGRFYLDQGLYNAAINRFKRVIVDYQTTAQVPEALHRLVECYVSLGLEDEARRTAAVLGYNYPGSQWYLDSYAILVDAGVRPPDDRDVFDRTLDSLF
jgi:outer membrane protein assembly factor BamD